MSKVQFGLMNFAGIDAAWQSPPRQRGGLEPTDSFTHATRHLIDPL
jgi:hypothetical protein